MKTEDRIQSEIFSWFQNTHVANKRDGERELIFAVPNQNQHKLAALGVLGGVSDLIFSWGEWTIYCEIKTPDGRQSPKQKRFEQNIKQLRSKSIYILVRSLDDVITFLDTFDK